MMSSFSQHDGIWWDPRDPSTRWVGTLRFDQCDGAVLSVTVPTDKHDLFPSLLEYDLLLGVTTDGKEVTLMGCFDRFTKGSFLGVPRPIEIFANAVILGFHCDQRDPLISTAAASLRHMNEWWGKSGIEADQSVKWPDMAARYTSPAPLLVHDDGRFSVSIRSVASGSIGNHKASLLEDVRFEIHAVPPAPLSQFRRTVQVCGDFLSIACLTYCGTTELSLVAPAAEGTPKRLGTFHAVPVYKSRERSPASPQMLFRFSDIRHRAPEALGAWLSEAERLHTTRTLYLAGVYGGGFIEAKLLALTQAVEAFHRRFYAGVYMDEDRFKAEVFEPLKAAIPASIDGALRAAVTSRLSFANEYSQRRRLQALFSEHREVLRILIEEPETYVSPIIDHRNEFTHFPRPSAEEGGPGRQREPGRVLFYNWILRLLLESCFLTAMGFSGDDIRSLVAASETYRQMSARFRDQRDSKQPSRA